MVGRPAVGRGPQEGAVEADHSRPESVGQVEGTGGVAHQDVRLFEERCESDEVQAARQIQSATRSGGPDDFGEGLLLGGPRHENRESCSGEQAGQLGETVRRPGERRSTGPGMKHYHGTALVPSCLAKHSLDFEPGWIRHFDSGFDPGRGDASSFEQKEIQISLVKARRGAVEGDSAVEQKGVEAVPGPDPDRDAGQERGQGQAGTRVEVKDRVVAGALEPGHERGEAPQAWKVVRLHPANRALEPGQGRRVRADEQVHGGRGIRAAQGLDGRQGEHHVAQPVGSGDEKPLGRAEARPDCCPASHDLPGFLRGDKLALRRRVDPFGFTKLGGHGAEPLWDGVDMGKLSVVVVSYNEEANLGKCLSSVSWADEIVVVDSFSQDRTVEIARRFTDRVFQHPWLGYGKQKNLALDRATFPWVLSLDADEVVSPELAQEIRSVLGGEIQVSGFALPRMTWYLGRFLRHCWYPDYKVRLFRKDRARWKEQDVHETVLLDGPCGRLRHPLFHYSFRSVHAHLEALQRYTSLSARQDRLQGRRFPMHRLLGSPWVMFLKLYVLKRGFLDGVPGLIASVLSAFHEFVKYAKLYELHQVDSGANEDRH